jgi:hypothetical protein
LKKAFDRQGSGEGNVNWWKPGWGDNTIRVLPAVEEDGLFYHETAKHRVGDNWFYCLKYHVDEDGKASESCPICDERRRLYRAGDESLIEIARNIKPRKQFLMNIVDRSSDDKEQVQVYASGVKLWNKMVTTMIDEDIDITDVDEGFDYVVKKEEGPKGPGGQSFPNYDNSRAKRKSTPLADDEDTVETILGNRINLEEIPRFDSAEIMKSSVDAYVKSMVEPIDSEFYSNDSSDEEEETTEETQKPAKATANKSSKKSSLDSFKAKLHAQLNEDDDDDDDE